MLKTMWPPAPSMHEARTALKIRFNSVTGLPSSMKSVILSIFNRFFKSAHFIALDLGAKVSLSSGYRPQSNSQTEMLIQEFEFALHCVTTLNPVTCSLHLPWVEYAHNSLTSSTTGLSTFEASLGYHPPLFLQNEVDLAVTSVQHHLQLGRCY